MKLPAVAIASIERAFNRLLVDQPDAMSSELAGKTIAIELHGIELTLYFYFQSNRVAVLDNFNGEPDACIAGTPIALAAVGISKKANTADIQLSGDLQLAQAFEGLLGKLSLDWEEYLSQVTGDVIAFRVGEMVRDLTAWGKRASRDFSEDARDYLQLEAGRLPLPNEVEQFNRDVDEVRAATERLEMRIQRLAQRRFGADNA